MIAILLENVELAYQHKNMKCVEAEISVEKSITYKTFHLLNALKQYGVLSALINVIVKQYIDNHTGTDGAINIDEFGKYVDEIIKDYKNNNEKFIKIHEIAFELWRFALLCPSADMPRQEAKKIISLNNVNRQEFSYTISFPKGQNARDANLKHCSPTGIPIIVIHHMHPAKIHASPPNTPPNINQRIFPNVLITASPLSPLF